MNNNFDILIEYFFQAHAIKLVLASQNISYLSHALKICLGIKAEQLYPSKIGLRWLVLPYICDL